VQGGYQVTFTRAARDDLARLPAREQRRIAERISRLATMPRPVGAEKLTGLPRTYRVRAGDYRVVYQVDDGARAVMIERIGHRRDVYRGL